MATSLSAVPYHQKQPPPVDVVEFENLHTVQGGFLTLWKQAPDPLLLYGMAITEPFEHPIRKGIMIQFFQKARFEFDARKPVNQQVSLANIGSWLYDETQRGSPPNFPVNNSVCRVFPETRHNVCYAFLKFYDDNQGATYFGQPISEVEVTNGRYVQFFERARMEWYAERPIGQRVVLAEIGWMDFNNSVDNPLLLKPPGPDKRSIPLNTPLILQSYAFVSRPLLSTGELQKVYVVIYDQYKRPVPDADVLINVIYDDPNRPVDPIRPAQVTNVDGFTMATILVDSVKPNQVVRIEVEAKLSNGTVSRARTWFRIWW